MSLTQSIVDILDPMCDLPRAFSDISDQISNTDLLEDGANQMVTFPASYRLRLKRDRKYL